MIDLERIKASSEHRVAIIDRGHPLPRPLAAEEDIEALVAEVERLQAKVERLQAKVARVTGAARKMLGEGG